jgi:hypothetical protein
MLQAQGLCVRGLRGEVNLLRFWAGCGGEGLWPFRHGCKN